jgi:DNA mismatch endonuclease (patch repair protein)
LTGRPKGAAETEPGGGAGGDSIPAEATDVYGPDKRSAVMRRVKGKDTGPELAVRRLLTGLGARYRLHRADLPGKPDIVLPGRRLAVFVHGCFWHGHDCARGARVPKANRDYWTAKVARNRARDEASRAALEAAGWRVETVWECELKDAEALKARAKDWLEKSLPLAGTVRRQAGDGQRR